MFVSSKWGCCLYVSQNITVILCIVNDDVPFIHDSKVFFSHKWFMSVCFMDDLYFFVSRKIDVLWEGMFLCIFIFSEILWKIYIPFIHECFMSVRCQYFMEIGGYMFLGRLMSLCLKGDKCYCSLFHERLIIQFSHTCHRRLMFFCFIENYAPCLYFLWKFEFLFYHGNLKSFCFTEDLWHFVSVSLMSLNFTEH